MTPSARRRLPQREHRTPRRLRPQPGLERPQPMMIDVTIPDELAARVPGDSADRGDFRRRGPNRVFEEGRSSAVDGRGAMVEGWPTIGSSLGPPRCNSDEPERSHRTQRREKESRETGHFFLDRFVVQVPLDVPRQGVRRLVSPVAVFLEGLHHNPVELMAEHDEVGRLSLGERNQNPPQVVAVVQAGEPAVRCGGTKAVEGAQRDVLLVLRRRGTARRRARAKRTRSAK